MYDTESNATPLCELTLLKIIAIFNNYIVSTRVIPLIVN